MDCEDELKEEPSDPLLTSIAAAPRARSSPSVKAADRRSCDSLHGLTGEMPDGINTQVSEVIAQVLQILPGEMFVLLGIRAAGHYELSLFSLSQLLCLGGKVFTVMLPLREVLVVVTASGDGV